MSQITRDVERNVLLQVEGNAYLLVKNSFPKVIFDKKDHKKGEIKLSNQIQMGCRYPDFIDCTEVLCDFLFSNEDIEKILIERPTFSKESFIKDGYDFEADLIVKSSPLNKKVGSR